MKKATVCYHMLALGSGSANDQNIVALLFMSCEHGNGA